MGKSVCTHLEALALFASSHSAAGAVNSTGGKTSHQSHPAVSPIIDNNHWPEKTCPPVQSGTNGMGVTNHFLIGCKVHSMRQNQYQAGLMGPRTCG